MTNTQIRKYANTQIQNTNTVGHATFTYHLHPHTTVSQIHKCKIQTQIQSDVPRLSPTHTSAKVSQNTNHNLTQSEHVLFPIYSNTIL